VAGLDSVAGSFVAPLVRSRFDHGVPGHVVGVLRIVAGVVFVTVSTGKFLDHAQEAADFDRYGVPVPDAAVLVVGTIELVCGLLLVVGLLTRPAAGLLALTMIGAIATAGRVEGGSFHLGVAPTLLAAMVVLVWAGAGRPSLDHRLATPTVRNPPV
jgi:putative oxidoreductase